MKKPLGEKMEFFRQYDEVLFNQLEKKILDLETANQQLRISAKEYRLQFKNISDVVFMIDTDFNISNISPSVEKLLGHKAKDFIGRPASDLRHIFTSESFERAIANISRMLKDERIPVAIYAVVAKDGTLKYVEVHGSPLIRDGKVAGTISVARDITERKRAEEALRESEQRLASIYNTVGDVIFHLAIEPAGQFRFISVNSAFMKVTGLSPEMVVGRTVNEIIPEPSLTMVLGKYRQAIAENTIVSWEEISDYPTGRLTGVVSIAPVFDDKGTCTHLVGSVQDITERKRMEEDLQESEERFRLLSEAAFEAIAIHEKGVLLNANDQYFKMFGYEPDEALGKEMISATFAPESLEFVKKRIATDSLEMFEAMGVRKDGTRFPMEIRTRKMEYKGRIVRFGAIRDITDRKRFEEKIHASLREKDILISEIHHRVKNNLQVISSLLRLQAKSSEDPELIEMLNGIQGRIRSMAMIHEKLYDTNDFTRIKLSSYVKALSQDLFKTHNINPGKIGLTIQTDGEVYVDVTKAIPCGLVLNELISNALKHAFPGDRKGKLQIILSETKNAEINIVVRDNGVGLPDNIDIHQPQTLGLELLNGLVKNQLDGQIEVRRDNGTEIRLKFPL
jgi:PAS domain S-box-containing protein